MYRIPTTTAIAAILLATGACGKNPDALDENFVVNVTNAEDAAPIAALDPQERCASTAAYDQIKLELFRQAVEVRGRDKAAFDKIAAYSFVRMDRPMLRGYNEASGEVTCTGLLTLDLPPGLAAAGGANRLGANIGYIVRPGADGSGGAVTIAGADPIIVPLATLARTAAPPPDEPVPVDPLAPITPPATAPENIAEPAPPTD